MFNIFKKKKTTYPVFWQNYLDNQSQQMIRSTPINDLTFVVFDTETTGLNPRKDKILSIGAVKVHAQTIAIEQQFGCYVSQEHINRETIPIHGILQKGKYEKVAQDTAIISFVEYVGDAILVGHNVGFDVAIINQALSHFGNLKLKNKIIDTAPLAIRADGHSRNTIINSDDYTLDSLCLQYRISMSDRHTASGDAFITAILLIKLLAKLKARGVHTVGELLKRRSF